MGNTDLMSERERESEGSGKKIMRKFRGFILKK